MTSIRSDSELLEKIKNAVYECGWSVLFLNSSNRKSFRMRIYKDDTSTSLIIYIWNVTYGGFPRAQDEFRIQVKTNNLLREPGFKTLILGWYDEDSIFVGWDERKHQAPKWSSSLQIKLDALLNARQSGLCPYVKENQETAIAFRSDLFVQYVLNLEQFHGIVSTREDALAMQQVATSSAISEGREREYLNPDLDAERKKVLTRVSKAVRNASFARRVMTAYGDRCAMCGMQLKLLDAAHILPVSEKGSTDSTSNGIALCALHHRAYDNALITFTGEYKIVLNDERIRELQSIKFDGGLKEFKSALRRSIITPPDEKEYPDQRFVKRANEFRGWANI